MRSNKPSTVPELIEAERHSDLPSFDYSLVDPSVASFLKGQATRIVHQCVVSAVQIGKLLIGAKHYLSHGQFLCWIESEVGISGRTAQLYMRAAQWASGKSETVSRLQPSVLYLLSAPSTPEELRVEMLNRIESGERIAPTTIRAEIRRSRTSVVNTGTPRAPALQSCGTEDIGRISGDDQNVLADAITILVSELRPSTFARVRKIMTSPKVLNNPYLARSLAAAFAQAESVLDAVSKTACTLSEVAPL